MEWSIFALLQMFLIALAISTACWLRMRGANAQNAQLREQLENHINQPVSEHSSPEDWLKAQVQELPADTTGTAVAQLVCAHLLEANPQFEEALIDTMTAAGLANADSQTDATHTQQIAALEAELASLQEASESGGEGERTEELKSLLQQFTKDSREMMACIQTLETENALLKEQLGETTEPVNENAA
jgi:hypothetical protein